MAPASRSTAAIDEYGNTKDCPEWDNHHVTWSLGDKYSGISIDANTGLLTVKRNSLSRTDTDIVIIARAGGKDGVPVTEVKGYMTVRKGSSSSGGGSDDDSDDSSNQQQWSDIQKEIRRADKGDTISANIAGNTNFPVRVLETSGVRM